MGFRVGAEEIHFVLLANLGDFVSELVSQLNRHGHQLGSFVASVTEHHALIPGAASVNAHGDVRRLPLHSRHNAAGFGVKTVLCAVVADFVDHLADNGLIIENAAEFLLDGNFTGHDHQSGGDQGFAPHAAHGIVGHHRIEHGVGNCVGYFIGVPFGYRFGRKQEFLVVCQSSALQRNHSNSELYCAFQLNFGTLARDESRCQSSVPKTLKSRLNGI